MFGFSIFLNEALTDETLAYMKAMREAGFAGIFSSIHIPEDDDGPILERLKDLGDFVKAQEMELVIDISGDALTKLGLNFEDVSPLITWGITGLRMDYGISNQVIADLSHQLTIALNASTISEKDLLELKTANADFTRMEAWHNYYPRPETGLGSREFAQQNQWLAANGFTVMTFVPGDHKLRGPLFEGLPTLEKHRGRHPFVAALDMKKMDTIDKIYIGDPQVSQPIMELFQAYIENDVLKLSAKRTVAATVEEATKVQKQITGLSGLHSNRMDAARDSIRSAEARGRKNQPIEPLNTISDRPIGTITIDNELYGRYAGEVQITKKNLPADQRINVLGRLTEASRDLVNYCGPGQTFEIIWEE